MCVWGGVLVISVYSIHVGAVGPVLLTCHRPCLSATPGCLAVAHRCLWLAYSTSLSVNIAVRFLRLAGRRFLKTEATPDSRAAATTKAYGGSPILTTILVGPCEALAWCSSSIAWACFVALHTHIAASLPYIICWMWSLAAIPIHVTSTT